MKVESCAITRTVAESFDEVVERVRAELKREGFGIVRQHQARPEWRRWSRCPRSNSPAMTTSCRSRRKPAAALKAPSCACSGGQVDMAFQGTPIVQSGYKTVVVCAAGRALR